MQSVQYMYEHYPWINFNIRVADSEIVAKKVIEADLDFWPDPESKIPSTY